MGDDGVFDAHVWEADWAEVFDTNSAEGLNTPGVLLANVCNTATRGDSEFDVPIETVRDTQNIGVNATRVPGLRAAKRRQIIEMLDRGERLITITGLGGIGKSHLAQDIVDELREADPEFSSSTHTVAAAEANIHERLADELGDAAGPLALDGGPTPVAGTHLAVIDGGEHLLDNAEDLETLLEASPGLRLLITSRTPLRIPSENTLTLRGLDTGPDGDGVRLFLALAKQHSVQIPESSHPRVRDIVARLGGYPLALRLCVAQLQSISLNALHKAMLTARTVHTDASVDESEPDAGLRQVIAWSLDRQSADAVKLLKLLSVSRGWSTLDSIEGIAAIAERRIGHPHRRVAGRTLWLSELVEAGLVDAEDAPPLGEDAQLYRAHDSIRDVVREYRVQDETPEEVLVAAHHEWYSEAIVRLAADTSTRRELAAFELLQAELSEYVAVLDSMITVDPMEALIIVNQIGEFWVTRGRIRSGARLLRHALVQLGEDPDTFASGPLASVLAQSWLAHMRLREGAPLDTGKYQSWLASQVRRMHSEADEATSEYFALAVHFIFLSMVSRTYPAALQLGARCRDLAIKAGDDYHAGLFCFYLARVSEQADDLEEAITHIGQAIVHVRRTHNESFLAKCISQEVLLRQDTMTPIELIEELAPLPEIHLRNRNFKDAALITIPLVIAYFRAGESTKAIGLLRQNLALSRRIHYFDGQLYSVVLIAFAELSPESTPENVVQCARLYGGFRPYMKRFEAVTADNYVQQLHGGIRGLQQILGQSVLDQITAQSPASWPQLLDEADAFASDVEKALKAREPEAVPGLKIQLDDAMAQLNEREHELLTLVLTGITDKQIAERLGLRPNTVRSYNSRIFRKFRVASRTEMLALFRDRDL